MMPDIVKVHETHIFYCTASGGTLRAEIEHDSGDQNLVKITGECGQFDGLNFTIRGSFEWEEFCEFIKRVSP
jgi:hypothetical protein